MMLIFAYPAPRLQLGPFDSLRFEGEEIRSSSGGTVLARNLAGQWEAGGRMFYRAECIGPLTVRLDGADSGERLLGPFGHFCVLGDTAYADREPLARFSAGDPTGGGAGWHLIGGQGRCAALVVASP